MDIQIESASRVWAYKDFSADLPREAALTHIGFYLGWAIARGMTSRMLEVDHAGDLAAFRDRKLTGPQLIGRLGGLLRTSQFNDELGQFSIRYYTRAGRFITDYVHTFAKPIGEARSMYVVPDTWENQDHLSALLDQRFRAWQIYPPAAHRIFGIEDGAGSYQDLETVSQTSLLIAIQALKQTQICRPFVVFLDASGEICVPQMLSYRGQNITVMTDEGVVESVKCLQEGLAQRTIKAFAAARLQSNKSDPPANCIEVIAQHLKSGPHRVVAAYTSDTSNVLIFERPTRIPATPEDAAPSPILRLIVY